MTMPEISRKQAWCKLAILIAQGMPDPESIDFNVPSGNTIFSMNFDSVEDMHTWARMFDATLDVPTQHAGSDKVQHHASVHRSWHGLSVSLWAYMMAGDETPAVDDLTTVTAVAEGAES